MTEREQILTSILDCERVDLYSDPKPLSPNQQKHFYAMLKRRAEGEPLQYILRSCEFFGLKFFLDKRVFIPRPETEILVDAMIKRASNDAELNILDIGTGSGNIAISIAKNIRNCNVTAVDVSKDALDTARLNAKENNVEDKISFEHCNIWPNVGLFDIIASNPPYIATADMDSLPVDVKHEPKIALEAGEKGIKFYNKIINNADSFLKNDGYLFLEVGFGQKELLEELFFNSGKFEIIDWLKDYADIFRVVIAKLK